MEATVDEVRAEIVALHDFFVAWFTGTAEPSDLESELATRLDEQMILIEPSGDVVTRDHLLKAFAGAHGTNPAFRIKIRDVAIHHHTDETIVATYTEWQVGSKASATAENARRSTVVMTANAPFLWLHVHETALPEKSHQPDAFDF